MNWAGFGRIRARTPLAMIAASVFAAVLSSCTTTGTTAEPIETPLQRGYERFQAYLEDCSKTHGTDPRKATGVGERELVAREREWRACAYEGIRALLVPATKHPELYAQMISEDQSMTDRIARGMMTRSERRARLEQLREVIAQKEGQARPDLSPATAERNAQLVRQVRGLP